MMHPNNPCANIAFLDRKRLPRWALLMFLLMIGASTLPTTGCMGVKKAADKLKDTSRRFNENVRWHNFKIASKFVVDTKREHWTRAMENAARRFTSLQRGYVL